MRVSLAWLKEFIPLSVSSSELSKILTMAGLEVDGCECKGDQLQQIVVAQVVESVKHPDADKLSVAKVFDGSETHQVVCGAPNCRPGIKVAFAPVGTKFKDEKGEFVIKKAKLRGVESCGMLCSAKEMELSDESDKIMEISSEVPVGTLLANLYGDTFFEISLTPNLNHCASIMGVARELSAVLNSDFLMPQIAFQESDERISDVLNVRIDNPDLCERYACRVIKNVSVGPSPDWLKERIESAGLRSINNVVDVTNYVLLEMGHPLHAFDYDLIQNNQIIVRSAKKGEKIQTLDKKERILTENMLVIADSEKPLAIAGIMGGLDSEVTEQTRTVVLESAYFESIQVRKTSKQLGLSTDASKRFERGSDPNQTLVSLDRASQLIQKVAGGEILKDLLDCTGKIFFDKSIACRLTRINQILGLLLSRGEVETIFSNLRFPFDWDGVDTFKVQVPTYRNDIGQEIDLIEEVARIYGYDNIPKGIARFQTSNLPPAPVYVFEKQIRAELISEGLQEFLTCDLIGPSSLDIIKDTSLSEDVLARVLNPTSIEQSILRTSLLPGLLQVVKYNVLHQIRTIAGFEIGCIHFKEGDHYVEQPVVGIVLTGQSRPWHWDDKPKVFDFYDLKGIVENVLEGLGIVNLEFRNLNLQTFHSGRQVSVFVNGLELGSIGELHPAIQKRLDVPGRILFAEFNIHDLMKAARPLEKVLTLAAFPSSERDWTCTIQETVPCALVMQTIEKFRPPLLEEVSLKDVYRSDKLPVGFQNITLRFVYRDKAKTMTQQEVDSAHGELIHAATQDLTHLIKQ